MKITLKQIRDYTSVMNDFYQEKLPLSCTYKLAKINSIIEKDLEFYKDELRKIIAECAQRDDDGNLKMTEDQMQVLLDPDKTNECLDSIKTLEDMEIDIECEKYLLDINEFGTEKQISMEQLNALIPFFK